MSAPTVQLSPTQMREARSRALAAQAQSAADSRAKREAEALVVAGLTIFATAIAVYDLVLLTVGLS